MAELLQPLSFPRISVFSARLRNQQIEKFRTISGGVTVTAEIAATADQASDVDLWIHYYVDAVTKILGNNKGDWGNGIFFPGPYEVDIQSPAAGGSGFLQIAHITLEAIVSRN
jgi:hypothetical protein